jgi:4'-phosphopantetheinyl transferase
MMAVTSADGECHVFWACVDTSEAVVWHLLDHSERERARRYSHAPARGRFVLGRGLARLAVAQIAGLEPEKVEFTATCRHCGGPHGRLEVNTADGRMRLSVSHSGTRVGVALTWEIECGLDIEQVALRGQRAPTNALSPPEREVFAALPEQDRVSAFIRTWTRKEAVLKATGDGLLHSPANLTMSLPWQPARLDDWTGRPPPHTPVHLYDLDVGPEYRASLATLSVPVTVIEHEAHICWLNEMTAPF